MLRRTRLLCAFVALAMAAFGAAFPVLHLGLVRGPALAVGALLLVLPAVLLVYVRLDRAPRIQWTLETMSWSLLLGNLFYFPMYALVRLRGTTHDALLAWPEEHVGLRTADIVAAFRHHPGAAHLLDRVYYSLVFVSIASVVLPPLVGKLRWALEQLCALAIALVVCLTVLALVQGIGPWVLGGFEPDGAQKLCEKAIRVLETPEPFAVDLGNPDPLVSFPSWHVILATLSATTMSRFRIARLPKASAMIARGVSFGWLALLTVSTLTTGWHYVIDSIAGLAVGASAIALARRFLAHEPDVVLVDAPKHEDPEAGEASGSSG